MSPDAIPIGDTDKHTINRIARWPIPASWARVHLHHFLGGGLPSIDPGRAPHQAFVLYSVPAFEIGRPETMLGRDIGSAKRMVAPRSVLLCRINPRINRAWVVSYHEDGKAVIASTEWIVFSPNECLVPDYLRYFLSTERVRQYLAANVSGVGGSLNEGERVHGRNGGNTGSSPDRAAADRSADRRVVRRNR